LADARHIRGVGRFKPSAQVAQKSRLKTKKPPIKAVKEGKSAEKARGTATVDNCFILCEYCQYIQCIFIQ